MTLREKLAKEFSYAIAAIYGDEADKEYVEGETVVSEEDLIAIARKVKFYID